jgi:hypothetical protein
MRPRRVGNALYAPPGCCGLSGTIPPEQFVLGVVGLGVVLTLGAFAVLGARRR